MFELKKSLNEEVIPEFIEKDNEIEYTEEDINFYNEYLSTDNVRDTILAVRVFFITVVISLGFSLGMGIFRAETHLYSIIITGLLPIIFNVIACKGIKNWFKSFGLLYKLIKLIDSEFNNHYFLKQKVSKKLEEENIQINSYILNKIIKKYPKKEVINEFISNKVFKDNRILKNEKEIYETYKVIVQYLDK